MENQSKIKILDGATGSLLQSRHPELYNPKIWMNRVITEKPEELYKIHEDYQIAGADILTTFTFRTNPLACSSLEESKILVSKAVEQAQKIKKYNNNILLYGSNSPAEDCYQKERTLTHEQIAHNHRNHIQFLKDEKVDCVLNETMSHLDELIVVCKICEEFGVPYVISLYFDSDLQILSGEKVEECLDILVNKHNFSPNCISFNCIQKRDLLRLLQTSHQIFQKESNLFKNDQLKNMKFGFYINCGSEDYTSNDFQYSTTPEELSQFYSEIMDQNLVSKDRIQFLGSCCMSTPAHTQSLSKSFS